MGKLSMDTSFNVCTAYRATSSRAMQSSTLSSLLVSACNVDMGQCIRVVANLYSMNDIHTAHTHAQHTQTSTHPPHTNTDTHNTHTDTHTHTHAHTHTTYRHRHAHNAHTQHAHKHNRIPPTHTCAYRHTHKHSTHTLL